MLKVALTFLILLQPALTVIDHGHFQYNSISLGLSLWGIIAVIRGSDILGSIAFSLSLNYKQMELYHSLPFFCYLLGKAFTLDAKNAVIYVLKLALAVISTFIACWSPFFYVGGRQGALQVLSRVFPFDRGIYEDKVASFWCSVSVLVKVRAVLSSSVLLYLSVGMTLVAALPALWKLVWSPTPYRFLLALVSIIATIQREVFVAQNFHDWLSNYNFTGFYFNVHFSERSELTH